MNISSVFTASAAAFFVISSLTSARASAQSPAAAMIPPAEKWAHLPVTFVENLGQYEPGVRFATRRGGLETLLMEDGFFVRFVRFENKETEASPGLTRGSSGPRGGATVRGAGLRFRFEGLSKNLQIHGGEQNGGKVNYLIGNDSKRWVRGAQTYQKIQYQGIYSGVDAVFHDGGGITKYDLNVAPGADLAAIRLVCEGAAELLVDADGALVARTAAGEFRQPKPVTFEVLPDGSRVEVDARYVLFPGNRAGFEIKNYNSARALVIDPGIVYGTFIGGNGSDAVQDITVDATGNAYVTGYTSSTNFPVKAGVIFDQSNGNYDAFVMKIKPDGSDFVFSTYLGGIGVDQGLGIAVDSVFNIYVCGSTLSTNFPTTPSAVDKSWSFGTQVGDAFITKLRNDGGDVLASTYLGGSGDDIALKIGIDTQLNVYVTGWTRSTALDFPTENGFQTTYGGNTGLDLGDAFITKFNSTLSGRMYSSYLGGPGNDAASGLYVNPATGVVLICGLGRGGFPTANLTGSTGLSLNYKSNGDAFIASIDTTKAGAASMVFSGLFGGQGIDSALDVTVDASNAIYATGYTESFDFPAKAGSFDTTYNNLLNKPGDGWVAKFNSTGKQTGYATFLGGNAQDAATSLAVDTTGAAYVCGRTYSGDFPKVTGAFDSSYNGKLDGFVVKLNPAGSAVAMANFIGGTNDDNCVALALRGANDVYVGGITLSAFLGSGVGFDTTINTLDGFVMRLDLGPVPSLCLDSSAALTVSHVFGNAVADTANRIVQNCGSLDSTLNWTLAESPDAPWLSESLTSGSVNFGAVGDTVTLTLDPTGLALGAYKTSLQFANTANLNNTVSAPVTFVIENGTVTPMVPGDTFTGTIAFESETDVASIEALKGSTVTVAIATVSGNLKPNISLLDNSGTVIKTYQLANSTKTVKKTFAITADGNYKIRVGGYLDTTGDYSGAVTVKLPKDSKAITKKNKGPAVAGLPIDTKIRMLNGATLNVTAEPKTTLGSAIGILLFDPNGASVDVTGFTQAFGVGGLQLVNVPISSTGQFTVRVTGPATTKEKVNIVITPTQPVGTSAVVLQ